jgi:hypothetical protein
MNIPAYAICLLVYVALCLITVYEKGLLNGDNYESWPMWNLYYKLYSLETMRDVRKVGAIFFKSILYGILAYVLIYVTNQLYRDQLIARNSMILHIAVVSIAFILDEMIPSSVFRKVKRFRRLKVRKIFITKKAIPLIIVFCYFTWMCLVVPEIYYSIPTKG